MLLQPLVENALYHGIKNKRGGGCILIRGYEDRNGLVFEIEDNGIGMDETELAAVRILGGRSFEPLGLKKDFNFGEITAADIGRMNVTKEERDKLRQKVPGLRNVALTAPYFHRGDVPTLDGAVKLMLRYQVGKELPQEDVDDIVAFLHSLNGVYMPYMQDKQ